MVSDEEGVLGARVDLGDALVRIGKDLERRLGSLGGIEAVGVLGLRAHLLRAPHGFVVVAVEQVARDRLDLGLDLLIGRLLGGFGGCDEHACASHRARVTRKQVGLGNGRQTEGDRSRCGAVGGKSARSSPRRVEGRHASLLR